MMVRKTMEWTLQKVSNTAAEVAALSPGDTREEGHQDAQGCWYLVVLCAP